MRARTTAILLLALAACSVKLEGAACTGDDNCPGGQKCGFDGKCSNAAAACAEPICRPGTHGCGSDGTIVPCEAELDGICATFKASGGEDCGAGVTCGPSVTCVDMFAVTLDAPAPGAVVGPAGVAVQATVTLASSAVAAPPTIKLLEGSTANADLTFASQTGLQAHYQGTYVSGPTTNCSVALYAVAAYGTADATSSPAVTVAVEKFCGVTLDAPAPGTVVGPAGVAVQATVSLASSAVAAPPTIKLLEGSTPNADLTLASQTGLQVKYQGTYVPSSTPSCSVSVALYAVAAYGTADGTSSPAVTVVVEKACAVTLDAPAPGTVVGPTGVAVQATATLASAAAAAPSTITLLEGSTAKANLTLTSKAGLQAHYQGTYSPGITPDGPVTLEAVSAYGTANETRSPVVTVVVDKTPPVISGAALTCAVPCLRNSVLTLSANVTDLHLGPVTAQVAFPAPVGPVPVVLTAAGTTYSGTLDVGSLLPFPFFSSTASATFTATDQVGNASASTTAPPVSVTRLRWATAVESSPQSLTGAAVSASGNVYVGAGNGKVYVLTPAGAKSKTWPVPGATSIAAAPAVGTAGVWVASQSGTVYLLDPNLGTVLNGGGSGCATGGVVTATPAIAPLSVETAFVGSQVGRLFAVAAPGKCTNSNLYEPFYAAAAIDGSNNVYAASDQGRLRSVKLDGTGFFVENWTNPPGYASVGASVRVPLALNAAIWSASYETNGQIYSATTAGAATLFATGGSLTDPILLSDGDVVVGDGNFLRRWNDAGVAQWGNPPNLGASIISPMAIANGDASFIVPTADGKLHAVKADGTVLWTGQVTAAAGTALREPNILKLATETFSTAVFGAADGNVYGVIVDGDLDATSPWPKAHHDTRNTGNASAPLP